MPLRIPCSRQNPPEVKSLMSSGGKPSFYFTPFLLASPGALPFATVAPFASSGLLWAPIGIFVPPQQPQFCIFRPPWEHHFASSGLRWSPRAFSRPERNLLSILSLINFAEGECHPGGNERFSNYLSDSFTPMAQDLRKLGNHS